MLPALLPEHFCLVSGVGVHQEDKVAQDLAGRQAGIHDRNIITVSSILPAGCQEVDIDFVRKNSRPAQILYAIDGKCKTSVEGQIVSAGLAVVIPDDLNQIGFFAEIYEEVGLLPEIIKERVEKAEREAERAAARLPALPGPTVSARIRSVEQERDRLARRVDTLEKQLAEKDQELQRIKKTIRP